MFGFGTIGTICLMFVGVYGLSSCEAIKVSADVSRLQSIDGPSDQYTNALISGNVMLTGYLPFFSFVQSSSALLNRDKGSDYHYCSYRPDFRRKFTRETKVGLWYALQGIGKGGTSTDNSDRSKLIFVELPVYVAYRHENAYGGVFTFGAGGFAAYGLSGKVETTTFGGKSSKNAFGSNGLFNRFDAGLCIGADYKFDNGLSLGAMYEHGMNNLAGAGGSKLYTRCLSFNLGFSLQRVFSLIGG